VNTRSLKFRLVVWYALLLTAGFILLGAAAYAALQSYLVGALKASQGRRAKQIANLVIEESSRKHLSEIGAEIEARYAPGLNERYVRVSQKDGGIIYHSSTPASLSFFADTFPEPVWPGKPESFSRIDLANRRELMVATRIIQVAGGPSFLVEAGSPMDDVQSDLRQWLIFLLWGLPLVAFTALIGGYLLVGRALRPVDEIAASAERISSHNLSERLPAAKTGDELERLSIALNHMIERLEKAFHHSRRFMADASHELRTPLTVLRGEIESCVEAESLPSEWRDRLGSALEEIERLVNIVEGLFAISRLDAGEAQAESVLFDLAELTSATADQMSLLSEDKQITVKCLARERVYVKGDRARMKQVIVNLLDNAIKYTPPAGSVTLTVSSGEHATLEVADTGMGIPEKSLPLVFDRFFRVDDARSRAEGGAGLGLSIVQSICAAHQGRVEARSAPGNGSTFRVELPLAAPPAPNGRHAI
jgi:heavy metal sensor kinase